MAKTFKAYFAESETDYKFKLKLAVNEVTDKMVDALESCLARYELVSASAFKKTPIQESPLDFPNIKNSPVFISDIVTTYPASRDFLETYISKALQISEQSVVVYSENDPREYTTDFHLKVTDPDYKKNYKPALGEDHPADAAASKAANEYGNTMSFLKELEEVRKERRIDIVENPLSPAQAASDVPADYDNFNKDAEAGKTSVFGRAPKRPELIRK